MRLVRVYKTVTMSTVIEVSDKLAQNLSGDCDEDTFDDAYKDGVQLAEDRGNWAPEEQDYEFDVLED